MKKLSTLALFLGIASSLWAQNPSVDWGHFGGGIKHDYLVVTEIDPITGDLIEIFETQSRDLPQTGVFACDTLISCCDEDFNIYIRKINPFTNQLKVARYYGGAGNERKPRIDIFDGKIYMTLSIDSQSGHLATLPSHIGAGHQGEIDVITVIFDLNSFQNLGQRFHGGSWSDIAGDIYVDDRGVFLAIATHESSRLPIFNGGLPHNGKYDVNLSSFSHDLSQILFSGNFGGSEQEGYDADGNAPIRMEVLDDGKIAVLTTSSSKGDILRVGDGYWAPNTGFDILGMVLEVQSDNSIHLLRNSLWGTTENDEVTEMVYQNGVLYGLVQTTPLNQNIEDIDALLFGMSSDMRQREWYLNFLGNSTDFPFALEVTGNYLFFGLETYSNDLQFPATGYQTSYAGNGDGLVIRLNLSDNSMKATYLGAPSGVEGVLTLKYHPQMQKLFAGGFTGSPFEFPTNYNGFDPSHAGRIDGFQFGFNIELGIGEITGLGENTNLPVEYALSQNYPNPFNPTTTISFSLPEATQVSLKIYDVLGREASSLLSGVTVAAGHHSIVWDASRFSSGTYFYTIQAGDFVATHKMILMK